MVAANILLGEDGRVAQARVAVGACSARPLRLSLLEAELMGRHPDAAVVRSDHLADLAPIDDMRATAAYRAMAALELVRRSITGLTSIAAAA
jgi:CO/xanthine dehydrogenase FAD-binding subunit